jgi:putative chitinase
MKITINTPDGKPSWIKLKPVQSSQLAGGAEIKADPAKTLEKVQVKHGQVFWVKDAHIDRDQHVRLVFDKPAEFVLGGKAYAWPEAYLFSKHCQGYNAVVAQKVVATSQFSAAGSSKLIVPCTYRSQVDNSGDTGQGPGWRQCASTSAVMFLETAKGLDWLKELTKGFDQPEDWYTTQLTKKGYDTTDPQAHVEMINGLGVPVTFRYDCSVADLNDVLDRGLGLMAGVKWRVGGHYVMWTGRDLVSGHYAKRDPYGLQAFDGDDPIDEYVTIGSGGDIVWLSMKQVQNTWLDLGDKAGWAMFPKAGIYGFNYQKPSIVLSSAPPPKSDAAPTEQPTIEIIADTLLKHEPIGGDQLSADQKTTLKSGTKLPCKVIGTQSGHARLQMPDGTIRYVFNKHFKGQESAPKGGDFCVDRATLRKAVEAIAGPSVTNAEIDGLTDSLIAEGAKYTVGTKLQICHFLGQVAHESGGFLYTEEIGDDAYFEDNYGIAVRSDLGNEKPGDGAKYHGYGLIQTTGLANVKKLAAKIGRPEIIDRPELIAEYPLALVSALSWWQDNKMVEADRGIAELDIVAVTKVVNGGTNGLQDRIDKTLAIANVLGVR